MCRLVLLFLLFPSTALAVWPLYFEFDGQRHFLGPLFSYSRDEDGFKFTLRPILSTYDSKGPRRFLYPLGKISEGESYLIPIYVSKRTDGERYWNLFLLFGGQSEAGEYGGLFPLFGKALKNFGRDRIDFALWPIYSHIVDQGRETTHLFWPFLSFYGGRHRGFRLWPLYGIRDVDGGPKSEFLLWPFLFLEEDETAGERKRFFFPFFISQTSKGLKETYVLWPFFSHREWERGEDWKILWPLFSVSSGEDRSGLSVFPLFSYHVARGDREFSLLWPLFEHKLWHMEGKTFEERRFLLLSGAKQYPKERSFTLWPLFDFQRTGQEYTFLLPFLLPLRGEEITRIVYPLITVLEVRRRGEKRTANLLYGLFTEERNGKDLRRRIAFLLDYRNVGGSVRLEVLSGLLRLQDGRLEKLLFLPVRRAQRQTFP